MSSPKTLKLQTFRPWLVICAAALLGYLPTVHRWGFYRDDWHVLWGQNAIGYGNIFVQHQIDRPLMGLVYMATARVLGSNPLLWALLSVALRLASAILVYLILEKLYARAGWANTLMAALFAVYPGFQQVPNGNSYHVHLIAFASGLLSLYLTLICLESQRPLARRLLQAASVLSGLLSYGMFEWMVGLELVRLILTAWHGFPRLRLNLALFKRLLLACWPNLLGLSAFLVWRVFFFESTRSATDVGQVLRGFLAAPGQSALTLGMELFKDFLNSTFLAWGVPFYQLVSGAAYADLLLALALAGLAVGVASFLLSAQSNAEPQTEKDWAATAVRIGLLCTLACLLPTVAAGRHIIFRDGLERYTLLASFGVVQFLTGGLFLLMESGKWRKAVLLALLASAVIVQNLNGAAFGRFWESQRQLWWQLSWRIPDLQDGAALIIKTPDHAPLAEDYEVWGPANLIYRPDSGRVLIAGETFSKETLQKLTFGSRFGRTLRNIAYAGNLRNAVVVSYPNHSCVHVMDPALPLYSLNDDLQAWLAADYSNPSMILAGAADRTPPPQIFGPEPARGWCYTYQKVSLAIQFAEWQQAALLADQARQQGLQPVDPAEWMPLYVAYAKTGNMDAVNELASILRSEPGLVENYCAAMQRQSASTAEFYAYNLCPELIWDK